VYFRDTVTALGYILALLIGLSLGLLGGGGSILTIPILHHVMGYDVKHAIPMSLVIVGITSGVGSIAHWRAGTVRLQTAFAFGVPAIVGAVLGADLGLRVSGELQLTVFAIVMLAASASMLLSGIRKAPRAEPEHRRKALPFITLIGGAVGLLTGFVGVGGGFLYVPTLTVLGGLPIKQAVGTSLVLILLSCTAGVARYQGNVVLDWPAIALFTAIALIGVAGGTRLVRFVSQTELRHAFGVFVLVIGALVLFVGR
jgi:uncharacterized membrane protein YfcA